MPRALTVTLAVAAATTATASYDTSRDAFAAWAKTHDKTYATDALRETAYKNYVSNAATVAEVAKRNPHASFGATAFADTIIGKKKKASGQAAALRSVIQSSRIVEAEGVEADVATGVLPGFMDWRVLGGVSAVDNQGKCGSGPAFAITANIEGVNFATNNILTPLSAAEIVSCASPFGACSGLEIGDVFTWLSNHTSGAIATSASFPYNPNNLTSLSTCKLRSARVGAVIDSTLRIRRSEHSMATMVAISGPIGVLLDANDLAGYTDGIMTNCAKDQADDAMAIVGYSNDAAVPYWIVKNSWGSAWGEGGFVRIAKGSNQCGIATAPWSVSVHKGHRMVTDAPPPPPVDPDAGMGKWLGIGVGGGVVGGVLLGACMSLTMFKVFMSQPIRREALEASEERFVN